jgi:SRSO17 transposase
MSGATVEATLELWAAGLREMKARLRPLFAHPSVAASAAAFLDGLLGPERRKTGWMRAEAAGDPGPWRQQAVLGRSVWDADALRDLVRDYALEALAAPDAVLVIDETGFLKQGRASCGVGRQYTGSAGKITNCQVGVFAAYVSDEGHALIDRRLYLPQSWTAAPDRLAAAHVPDDVTFATKPRLAVGMIARAIGAGVPFAWAAADSVYGVGEVETALRRAGKGYVLGVTGDHRFWSWGKAARVSGTAEAIAAALPSSAWRRLSAGVGTKGPRLHDWAYLELADLAAGEVGCPGGDADLWTRGLLVRRTIGDGELAFFSTWCPTGTPVETLVGVEGRRWAIEDAFETAKTELGLDHNETRSWHGWHRHVSLVMLAFALMAAVRRRANAMTSPPKRAAAGERGGWCAGRSRRSVGSPAAWPSAGSSPPSSSPGPSGDDPIKLWHSRPTSGRPCNCNARAHRVQSMPFIRPRRSSRALRTASHTVSG